MKSWRQEQRQRLLAARAAMPARQYEEITQQCLAHIADYLSHCEPGVLGMYWPIKRELDCRSLAESLRSAGWVLSVPVIDNERRELAFARWQPGMAMTVGNWNIPVPAQPEWVSPVRFLVPLVGFDKANYRLGYGGGYYDRTLANRKGVLDIIGVGMEIGRLETIHPHEKDIPMHRIITEAGMQMPEPEVASEY